MEYYKKLIKDDGDTEKVCDNFRKGLDNIHRDDILTLICIQGEVDMMEVFFNEFYPVGCSLKFLLDADISYNIETIKILVNFDPNIFSICNENEQERINRFFQKICRTGDVALVKFFLGLDITLNKEDTTAINYCCCTIWKQENYYQIAKLLIEHNFSTKNENLLINACETGSANLVSLLIENDADVNTQNGMPLVKAGIAGHIDIVKILLSNGANTNGFDYILHRLSKSEHKKYYDTIDLLVDEGVDVKVLAKIYAYLLFR